MRLLVLFAALAVIPATVIAKPRVAVAPLAGDADGKVAAIVAEVAAEDAKVIGPDRVERAMRAADVAAVTAKTAGKLRGKLEVDVVIYGKVERGGGQRSAELVVAGKGKARETLTVEFKTPKELRKALAGKLAKRIAAAARDGGDEDDGDEDEERSSPFKRSDGGSKRDEDERKKRDEDERKKRDQDERKRDEDERRARDDEQRRRRDDDRRKRDEDERARTKRTASDDSRARKRLGDEDDEDAGDDEDEDGDRRKRKRRGRGGDDDDRAERRPHPVTQAALWLDVGGTAARRTLTYQATAPMPPPPVGTVAPAGRISGELYPGAFAARRGPVAGIGIAGQYTRTFGLGIAVPMTTVTAPIDSGQHAIGVRYRFSFARSSIAVGASYLRKRYVADRSGLMMPEQLDMPDVDYTAVAPEVVARLALSPKLGGFAALDFPLMLSSGPIQENTSYGPSKIVAFSVRAGAQIVLGPHYAVHLAAELEQIGFAFTSRPGSQAALRGVASATDRSLGIAAAIGVMY